MLAPQVQRKRVPDLGSAEPEGALELGCPSSVGQPNVRDICGVIHSGRILHIKASSIQ